MMNAIHKMNISGKCQFGSRLKKENSSWPDTWHRNLFFIAAGVPSGQSEIQNFQGKFRPQASEDVAPPGIPQGKLL